MFNYLLVGGHFGDDKENQRPSGYIKKLFDAMMIMNPHGTLKNGGTFEELTSILEEAGCSQYQVVLWMPDVPNDKEKLVKQIKEMTPEVILVTSKNNKEGKYSFMEIVARALHDKANLFVTFTKGVQVMASVCDPLGNEFCRSEDINQVALALVLRLTELCKFTRVGSMANDDVFTMPTETPDLTKFLSLLKDYARVFHECIHPHDSKRFLGNASFRCESGFPSFKDDTGHVFVSKRNVDKRDIGLDAFVPVALFNTARTMQVMYWGTFKPSVDTPIQLLLYRYYTNIRYVIHSHTYVQDKNSIFTDYLIPCGAIEEFNEIIKICPQRDRRFAIVNLVGHGSLVMARDVSMLEHINYVSRAIPERI